MLLVVAVDQPMMSAAIFSDNFERD